MGPELKDREILLLTKQKVENMEQSFSQAVDRLTDSIKLLGESMKEMEVQRIQKMEGKVADLQADYLQIKGGWRAVVIICTVASAAIGYAIKYFAG